MDEGVDVDASAGAARVEHDGVEDAAVVGGPAEAGQDAGQAVGQLQEAAGQLGLDQLPPNQDQQDREEEEEEERPGGLHLHPGESATTSGATHNDVILITVSKVFFLRAARTVVKLQHDKH